MPLIMAQDSCKGVSFYKFFSNWRNKLGSRTDEEIAKAKKMSINEYKIVMTLFSGRI
jgi:hypothetical protein